MESALAIIKRWGERERERGGVLEKERIPGVTGQWSSLYKYILVVMLILRWWVFQDAVSS